MQVIKYCSSNDLSKFNLNTNNRIGYGADGEVFEFAENKVIKFSILYEYHQPLEPVYSNICNNINYIINNKPRLFVRTYEFGKICEGVRQTVSGPQNYIIYYYIMDKLEKISEDEVRIFHSILSHEDDNKEKNFTEKQIKKMLKGMSKGLDFNFNEVLDFYNLIKNNNTNINHIDLHPRNIMKDSDGKFYLIDFDRME